MHIILKTFAPKVKAFCHVDQRGYIEGANIGDNISILNNNGVKISHIADFTDKQINQKVAELLSESNDFKYPNVESSCTVEPSGLSKLLFTALSDPAPRTAS